jgi:glyoxylase-like metal-dependent hydrolase (beta-lactamase superfamily II)
MIYHQNRGAMIQTIDCQYLFPQFAAAYLKTAGDEAFFVDNNTTHSVPLLLDALKRASLRPEQVRYVIITHVHLDHAGGTSALIKACPNATLLAHPKAAIHMVDPSRLVSSARKVYGDAEFERLYGEILPIAQNRVRSITDGETVDFGRSKLEFFYTRQSPLLHFGSRDGKCFHGGRVRTRLSGSSKKRAFHLSVDEPNRF